MWGDEGGWDGVRGVRPSHVDVERRWRQTQGEVEERVGMLGQVRAIHLRSIIHCKLLSLENCHAAYTCGTGPACSGTAIGRKKSERLGGARRREGARWCGVVVVVVGGGRHGEDDLFDGTMYL